MASKPHQRRLPLSQKQAGAFGAGAKVRDMRKFLVAVDGQENVDAKPRVIKNARKSVSVGPDEPCELCDAGVNTDVQLAPDYYTRADDEQTTRDMLLSTEPTGRYHALLAEQRRLALAAALAENLELSQQLAGAREENRALRRLAEEGQRAADMLRELLEEAEQRQVEVEEEQTEEEDGEVQEDGV